MTRASTAVAARRHPDDAGLPLLTPAGGTAVMARRAATAPDELDYFPTPPWAGRAIGELIRRLDPLAASAWEPACGEGHLAWGLMDVFGGQLLRSDVFDYGCAEGAAVVDFLGAEALGHVGRETGRAAVDWIVSNPPFRLGEAFIRRAMLLAGRGVVMLLRLQFRESEGRQALFAGSGEVPGGLTAKATFMERVPMVKGRWDPQASTATAYTAFVFMHRHTVAASPFREAITAARAVGASLDLSIPPGTRDRLHRDSDLARFGLAGAVTGELFEEGQ